MIQGTSSAAGKSFLATALCRIFVRQGLRVAPFKAQNLSLNAAVTAQGDEIGRAQALQAAACRIPANVDMNPILLKPEPGLRTQIVLEGAVWKTVGPAEWHDLKPELWGAVTAALDRLRESCDLVIIEGAGSPVEINLKHDEIVNMRVARFCRAPVLLAASIELGGVFASLVGTMTLLEREEKELVKGFLINRFQGDLGLLAPGLQMLAERTQGVPTLGVIPFVPDLRLPEEDAGTLGQLGIGTAVNDGATDIAVVRIPHIANFDDCTALAAEPGVRVRFVSTPADLGTPAAIVLPGSKATLFDLAWLTTRGFASAIRERAEAGTAIVGLCGGYQMLGLAVRDPRGSEGMAGTQRGLALLPVETELEADKTTRRMTATVAARAGFFASCVGVNVVGYEIHRGRTTAAAGNPRLFLLADGRDDGATNRDGRVWGTYLHGVFDNPGLRRAWLSSLGWRAPSGETAGAEPLEQIVDREIDRIADIVSEHIDRDAVFALVGL